MMDFDNISIRSDDTDYLLSMRCQFDETDDHYKRTTVSSRYILTKSYLESLDSHSNGISLETSKYDTDQDKISICESSDILKDATNLSWRSLTGKYSSPETLQCSDILKQSTFPLNDLNEPTQKLVSNRQSGIDNEINGFDFDQLDEKVQEGQKIISRVLAEMSVDGQYKSKSRKSFESPLTNGSHKKKLTFSSSPILTMRSSHSSNNSNFTREVREVDGRASSRSSLSSIPNNESHIEEDMKDTAEDLLNKVALLKDKLVSMEVQKNKEILSLKERNEAKITSLEHTVNTLQKQKENFMEHVSQLKDSLAKKNAKCMQFQDLMKEKAEQINRLITKDDKERVNLQNEVRSLQMKKTLLDKQVCELEKALNKQLSQIKELDNCFQNERKNNIERFYAKEEEISSLHNIIKQHNETSMVLGEQITTESNLQVQEELNTKEIALENLEISLHREQERNQRLQEQFKQDVEELLNKLNVLKAANLKLQQENQQLKANCSSSQGVVDVENNKFSDEFHKLEIKLAEHEKFEKSLLMELSEESAKLAVITGMHSTQPMRMNSPGRSFRENATDLLKIFKDQLEQFRHYVLAKENESFNQSNESVVSSSLNTSTKLIKHLQSRVQQLRENNLILRETSHNETALHTANGESNELERLQFLFKQVTKENLLLQKAHAQLQHSLDDGHSLPRFHPELLSSGRTHEKALGPEYSGTALRKFVFDKCLIPWSVRFLEYRPVEYTALTVSNKPVWADPDLDSTFDTLKFNQVDSAVDRRSFLGDYTVTNGRPINPIGRTGMTGRGLLGKWGPNHAADPVVTCWLRDFDGEIQRKDDKPLLQFIAIQRKDTEEWAIPGGMVDAGENISTALKREFNEEALNSLETNGENRKDLIQKVEELFSSGTEVFRGYVDDPRNTDNAWIETVVVNFHDNNGDIMSRVPLQAGDDAESVRWLAIEGKLELYASHYDFIRKTCLLHDAYFPD